MDSQIEKALRDLSDTRTKNLQRAQAVVVRVAEAVPLSDKIQDIQQCLERLRALQDKANWLSGSNGIFADEEIRYEQLLLEARINLNKLVG